MQVNAIAVAHASQPNTVEFEFGAEWRLLQLRHAEQDRLLAQIHAKQIEELETKYREERKKLGLGEFVGLPCCLQFNPGSCAQIH